MNSWKQTCETCMMSEVCKYKEEFMNFIRDFKFSMEYYKFDIEDNPNSSGVMLRDVDYVIPTLQCKHYVINHGFYNK